MRLRSILTSAVTLLMLAVMVAAAGFTERSSRRLLTEEIEARMRLVAEQLASASAGALLSDYPELTLQPVLKRTLDRQPDVELATIVDASGRIQADVDAAKIGTPFRAPGGREIIAASATGSSASRLLSQGDLVIVEAPVVLTGQRRLGEVRVGVRRSTIARRIAATRRSRLLPLGVILVFGVVVGDFVVWRLLRSFPRLTAAIERLGRGEFDTPVLLQDRTELGMLADALNTMSWELVAAQASLVRSERLAREMELAREIQTSLLSALADPPAGYVIQARQRAATEVGGDYYELFTFPDEKVGLVIADVAGKGLAGCLVVAMLSALLRSQRESYPTPGKLLASLNRSLCDILHPGTFITVFYAILDPSDGTLVYTSAGHNPALIYRASTRRIEKLERLGPPLGLARHAARRPSYEDGSIRLRPGDVLLQTTDGVHEAFGPDGESQFGAERVDQVLAARGPSGGEAVLTALQTELDDWRAGGEISDDETLLVVWRDPSSVDALPRNPGKEIPMDIVRRARRLGRLLRLEAKLDVHDHIREWLTSAEVLRGLDGRRLERLTLLLYELVANAVEHGYSLEPGEHVELWWVPDEARRDRLDSPDIVSPGEPARARPEQGVFVMMDWGKPFQPSVKAPQDYRDVEARRRPRGHGLDIVRRMAEVEVHPSTDGNITLVRVRADQADGEPQEVLT